MGRDFFDWHSIQFPFKFIDQVYIVTESFKSTRRFGQLTWRSGDNGSVATTDQVTFRFSTYQLRQEVRFLAALPTIGCLTGL